METTEKKSFTTTAKDEGSKPLSLEKEKNSEIFVKTEVENTPFLIISHEEGKTHFGTFGRYKITEDYHTLEQCKADLEKITWNRIAQISAIIHETIKN